MNTTMPEAIECPCTVEALEAKFHLPSGTLTRYGVTDRPGGGVVIDYGPGKRKRYRAALEGDKRFLWAEGSEPIGLYDIALEDIRGDGQLVLVEGETDAVCGWANGFPCLGFPGCSMASKLQPEHVRDIEEVIVCKEPDAGGETFTSGLLARLKEIGFRGRAWVLTMKETFGAKDLADLHKENPAQFPQRLQRAIDALRQTEPAYPAAVESEPDAGKEPARLVADKLEFFLTIPTPVKRYLLRPLISSPSLGMVYGPRGIGKSHFVDAVAYGTAAGDRFLVWSAEYPIKTIMIDGEMPVSVQQERFTLQIKAFEKEAPPGYLQIVSAERQGETGIPDLARPEGQRAIESILGDCELLILDNLSSLVRSGVENEGESWLPLQTWLLSLRRRGVSVLLVHHSNKLGDQRGTSRREDVLDYILSLRRPRDYDPQQGCAFEVHFTKARGLWGKEVRAINARFETDPHGVASRWVWSYADDTLLVDVAEMATEGMSLAQIGKTLGMSKTAVHRRLEKAKQEGLYPIK